MASVRKTRTGRYELCIAHKLLPKRLFFTFDSEEAAREYGQEADRWLASGVVPAAFQDIVKGKSQDRTLTAMLQDWRNAGRLSKTDDDILGWLTSDPKIKGTHMSELTYKWAESWIEDMKIVRHLAPSSIRQRVQAVSKGLDWHLRSEPESTFMNPLRLLPRGYSIYTTKDIKDGGVVKRDVVRDRRLLPGEADQIRKVLRGDYTPLGERRIPLPEGDAMLRLFEVILHTGLRLREAYTIECRDINLLARVMRIKSTKQRNGNVVYRTVPIRPELYKWLDGHPATGLLFPFWDGNEETLTVTSNRLSHRFAKVFQHAQCENLIEHDLRHEATCQWFEMKDERGQWMYRPEEINVIMGWKPGSAMAARYASFRAVTLAERMWVSHGHSGSAAPSH